MSQSDGTIVLPSEPVLDGVQEEDRHTVRNVIYVMHSLQYCKSWAVTPKDHGYEIVGMTDPKTGVDISLQELQLIKSVDLLRVHDVSVKSVGNFPQQVSLVVFVLRKCEPIVLQEQEVVCIRKKRKFWSG